MSTSSSDAQFPDDYECDGSLRSYQLGHRCSKCRAANAAQHRKYRRTDNGKRSVRNMNLRKYGLTVDTYNEILDRQNGVCAICGNPETKKNQYGVVSLTVDHDHVTGQNRALVCMTCNRSLGMLGDKLTVLEQLVAYRRKHLRVYCAGPMSGIPYYNAPAFDKAEEILKNNGWQVVNPARLDREAGIHMDPLGTPISRNDYEAILEKDFMYVRQCDAIVFIPGWEKSEGAMRERKLGEELGLRFFHLDPETGQLTEEARGV